MSTHEEQILKNIRHDWRIASIDQHTDGYWDLKGVSFDLRELGIKENGTGQPYLKMEEGRILLCISGEKSYYDIEESTDTTLKLACYFQNHVMESGPIKIVTFDLTRE